MQQIHAYLQVHLLPKFRHNGKDHSGMILCCMLHLVCVSLLVASQRFSAAEYYFQFSKSPSQNHSHCSNFHISKINSGNFSIRFWRQLSLLLTSDRKSSRYVCALNLIPNFGSGSRCVSILHNHTEHDFIASL